MRTSQREHDLGRSGSVEHGVLKVFDGIGEVISLIFFKPADAPGTQVAGFRGFNRAASLQLAYSSASLLIFRKKLRDLLELSYGRVHIASSASLFTGRCQYISHLIANLASPVILTID